jgi:hypothetical protein
VYTAFQKDSVLLSSDIPNCNIFTYFKISDDGLDPTQDLLNANLVRFSVSQRDIPWWV